MICPMATVEATFTTLTRILYTASKFGALL